MPSVSQPRATQACITCQISSRPASISASVRQWRSFARMTSAIDSALRAAHARAARRRCGTDAAASVVSGAMRLLRAAVGRRLVADDEAAADRVVDAARQLAAVGVERREAHAVGVERQRLAAVEEQVVASRRRRSRACPSSCSRPRRADALEPRGDRVRRRRSSGSSPSSPSSTALSLPWPLPVAPSEPYSSTSTRATSREQPVASQPQREQARGAHRPDGVRTRRADADLEQVEDADRHGVSGSLAPWSGS